MQLQHRTCGPCADVCVSEQVLEYLEEQLNSRPETLTDMQRESQEEAQERHERVLAASLAVAAAFLDLSAGKGQAVQEGETMNAGSFGQPMAVAT